MRLAGDAGPDGHGRLCLGTLEDRVARQEVGIGAATLTRHPDRPCRVGAVALSHATDVDDDGLAGHHRVVARTDHSIAGRMMRGGRVGPGGDDREGGLVVPLVHEPIADLVSDVSLAASAKAPRRDGLHDPVGGRSGRPQPLDLVGVLDRPQLGHGLGRQPERGVG